MNRLSPPRLLVVMTLCVCAFTTWAQPASGDTQKNAIALEALSRLQGADINANPSLKAAIYRLLDQARGTAQFVQIVKQFDLKDQNESLLEAASGNPAADFGVEAIRVLLANQGSNSIKQALEGWVCENKRFGHWLRPPMAQPNCCSWRAPISSLTT